MIKSKLPGVGDSIFAAMTKLANEHKAINLSQGFPDFNCSEKLIELVHQFQIKGMNQYAPMPGLLSLREEIAKKTLTSYNLQYDPESEITITSGATQALFTAINTFVQSGDEVIVFEPAYDSYIPSIILNGGRPVPIKMETKNFNIDWDKVRNSVSSKTKMIIINTPHNPTGSILKKDDIDNLIKIANENDLLILSDEVYEHIIFDGNEHLSLSKYPELKNRTIIVNSFGKTFHTTGWKVGYVLAEENLTKEFRKVHQFTVFAVNTPVQYAYAEFLKDKSNYENLSSFYQQKRDLFYSLMKDSKYNLIDCSGTYFQLLDYSNLSDSDDVEFAKKLTVEAGVAVIPLSPFYSYSSGEKLIRICFAKTDEVLKRGAERLLSIG